MDRELLREKLPSMLCKIAKNEAEEGEYDPAEHVDWMAAEEIERLRGMVDEAHVNNLTLATENKELEAEIERLRADLEGSFAANAILADAIKAEQKGNEVLRAENERLREVG